MRTSRSRSSRRRPASIGSIAGTLEAVVSLVLLLLLVAAGVLAARRFLALRADGSRAGQRWATAEAVAEVDGDAGALIRRGLREVTGAETSERFERRVTFVATPEANVGFTVTALGD